MTTRRLRFSTILIGVCTACAAPRHPEPLPPSAPLPPLLATALIDNSYEPLRSVPAFAVGTLPSGYPRELLPSGPVDILGGMTTNTEVVAVLADSTRRLSALLEDVLDKSGYARPALEPGYGFVPASGQSHYFCKGDSVVSMEPLSGPHSEVTRVRYRSAGGARYCQSSRSAPSPRELSLPELMPPPGVRVGNSSSGGIAGGPFTRAEATGVGLVPSTILSHYAVQLMTAGWVAATPAIADHAAAQFFEAKDASGRPWEGVLAISGGGTSVDMTLAMHPKRDL